MKRVLTVAGLAIANVGAAVVVILGFVGVELLAWRERRRGCVSGAKVTPEHFERFYGDLAEQEFRVGSVGPTVIVRR